LAIVAATDPDIFSSLSGQSLKSATIIYACKKVKKLKIYSGTQSAKINLLTVYI
jgi:hypothetical protein